MGDLDGWKSDLRSVTLSILVLAVAQYIHLIADCLQHLNQ